MLWPNPLAFWLTFEQLSCKSENTGGHDAPHWQIHGPNHDDCRQKKYLACGKLNDSFHCCWKIEKFNRNIFHYFYFLAMNRLNPSAIA